MKSRLGNWYHLLVTKEKCRRNSCEKKEFFVEKGRRLILKKFLKNSFQSAKIRVLYK